MPEVEVRCPNGPRQLFTKLQLGEVRYVHPENLIEFSCRDCARRTQRETDTAVRVLHRYNFLGEHVETVTHPDTHAG